MGAMDIQVPVPPIVNSTNSESLVRSHMRLPKINLHTNAWRLVESEFHSLNALFSFTLEACCDPDGSNRHGLLPFNSGKDSFLTHDIAEQYVYCNPPWSLAVQSVEHIRTCHAKSPLNTKYVVILLPDWPRLNATTNGLRLLRQDLANISSFTKTSPLGERHTVVKVPWPLNY
jgi:hypothetical protein